MARIRRCEDSSAEHLLSRDGGLHGKAFPGLAIKLEMDRNIIGLELCGARTMGGESDSIDGHLVHVAKSTDIARDFRSLIVRADNHLDAFIPQSVDDIFGRASIRNSPA